MKKLITVLLFGLVALGSSAQQGTYLLHGTISITSFNQGGVELMPSEYESHPYQVKLYVVKYFDSLTTPMLVDSLNSDASGYYELLLPPGEYGFVTAEEKDQLKPGQCLPTPYHGGNESESKNIFWTATKPLPIKLEPNSSVELDLHLTDTVICGKCP